MESEMKQVTVPQGQGLGCAFIDAVVFLTPQTLGVGRGLSRKVNRLAAHWGPKSLYNIAGMWASRICWHTSGGAHYLLRRCIYGVAAEFLLSSSLYRPLSEVLPNWPRSVLWSHHEPSDSHFRLAFLVWKCLSQITPSTETFSTLFYKFSSGKVSQSHLEIP